MDNVRIILAVLFLIVAYKVITNHIRVMRLQALLRMYKRNAGNDKTERKIIENSDTIISLFRRAKLQEPIIAVGQPMGYGLVQPSQFSAWENIHLNSEQVYGMVINSFYRGIGYYRQRRNEALSPVYWIEFVLFAPRNLLSYVGFDANSALVKAFQAVAWIVALAGGIIAIVQFLKP